MNLSLSVVLPSFSFSETNNIQSHVERVKKKIEEELKNEKRKRDETKDKKDRNDKKFKNYEKEQKEKVNHGFLDMNESEGIVSEDTFFMERSIMLAAEWSPFSKHKDAIKARMMMDEPDMYKDVLYLLYGLDDEEKKKNEDKEGQKTNSIETKIIYEQITNKISKDMNLIEENTNSKYCEDELESPNSSDHIHPSHMYKPSEKMKEWRQTLKSIIKEDKAYIQRENEPSSES